MHSGRGLLASVIPVVLLSGLCHAQGRPQQREHRGGFVPVDSTTFALITQFYDFDQSLPLDARVVDTWETDIARFEKVVFTTQSGGRVPSALALPKRGNRPFPLVLFLHGLGNDRGRWWREDRSPLPTGLLEQGIAVVAIDLQFHGERAVDNDYQSPVYLTLGNSLFVRNRDMVIQSAIDSRRALVYLRQRQEVDSTRLGVMGYSLGAMIALQLSALEPDLRTVVVSAVPTGEQPLPIDHFQFAARSRIPTLLQFGRTDWLSSPQDAGTLLKLLQGKGNKLAVYQSGHQLPPDKYVPDALAWLLEKLR